MESNEPIRDYRMWLLQELTERTRRNPSYSLRAFARSLGVSAPSLSQVLSGKRPLSRKAALRIIDRCSLSPDQGKAFLMSALGEDWQSALLRLENDEELQSHQELQIETYRMISDWYHYAILSLGDIEGNVATPQWIAERLNISPKAASQAFRRLEKLGLVRRRGKGFFQCAKPLAASTKTDLDSALRKYHHQNLRIAEAALDDGSVPLNGYSAMTMAIDESRLDEARELIKKFRRKLCRVLENGERQRVYTLAIQLFPVSKPKPKKSNKRDPL